MSIRKRLLWLLLPTLICFVALTSGFFYHYWANEIYSTEADPAIIAQKLHHAIIAMILVTLATVALVTLLAIYIAETISQPLKKLNNAALEIAAGDYEENIQVEGPNEFVDLANTLNTMRECMEENMMRLKENSTARERLYGEYECAVLLQQQMYEKAIENYSNLHLQLHPIKITTTTTPYGLYLSLNSHEIEFKEANEVGFQGIFELLSAHTQKEFPFVKVQFNQDYSKAEFSVKDLPAPLIWKSTTHELVKADKEMTLQKGDLVFLMNQGLSKHFYNEEDIADWLKKLLKHFSLEGMTLFLTMLTNQLNFLVKKHYVEQDIYLLIVQI